MSQSSSVNLNETYVMVGTPCYGGLMHEAYFHSMIKLLAEARKKGYNIHLNTMGNESLITRARNTIVSQFMDNESCTHLLFIDADIAFQPELVTKLIEYDKDVVTAIYPRKTIEWQNLQYYLKKEDTEALEQKLLGYNMNFADPMNIQVENGFVEVLDAATGFMLIKKEVFVKMKDYYPELKYTSDQIINNQRYSSDWCYSFFDCIIDEESNRYLSEDYTFCRRWQKMGGKIYAEIASSLTHFGTYGFRGNVSHKFAKKDSIAT